VNRETYFGMQLFWAGQRMRRQLPPRASMKLRPCCQAVSLTLTRDNSICSTASFHEVELVKSGLMRLTKY